MLYGSAGIMDFRVHARTSVFDVKAGIRPAPTFVEVCARYGNEWGSSAPRRKTGKRPDAIRTKKGPCQAWGGGTWHG